jgi:hypothetical protein
VHGLGVMRSSFVVLAVKDGEIFVFVTTLTRDTSKLPLLMLASPKYQRDTPRIARLLAKLLDRESGVLNEQRPMEVIFSLWSSSLLPHIALLS